MDTTEPAEGQEQNTVISGGKKDEDEDENSENKDSENPPESEQDMKETSTYAAWVKTDEVHDQSTDVSWKTKDEEVQSQNKDCEQSIGSEQEMEESLTSADWTEMNKTETTECQDLDTGIAGKIKAQDENMENKDCEERARSEQEITEPSHSAAWSKMDETETSEGHDQKAAIFEERKAENEKSENKDFEQFNGTEQDMKEGSTSTAWVKTDEVHDQSTDVSWKTKDEEVQSQNKDCEQSIGSEQGTEESLTSAGWSEMDTAEPNQDWTEMNKTETTECQDLHTSIVGKIKAQHENMENKDCEERARSEQEITEPSHSAAWSKMDETETSEGHDQNAAIFEERKAENEKSENKDFEQSNGTEQDMKEGSTSAAWVKTDEVHDQSTDVSWKTKDEEVQSQNKDCEQSIGSEQEMEESLTSAAWVKTDEVHDQSTDVSWKTKDEEVQSQNKDCEQSIGSEQGTEESLTSAGWSEMDTAEPNQDWTETNKTETTECQDLHTSIVGKIKAQDENMENKDCEERAKSEQEITEPSHSAAWSKMDETETSEGHDQNAAIFEERKAENEKSENKDFEQSNGTEQDMKEGSTSAVVMDASTTTFPAAKIEINSTGKGLYPSLDEFSDSTLENAVRVLIFGKTGTGKSSLGNMLLGLENTQTGSFTVGAGIQPKTRASQVLSSTANRAMMVLDTPDIRNLEFDKEKNQKQVSQWKEWLSKKSSAILLTHKVGTTYTPEEYAIFEEIKRLWENDTEFCQRLIVAFTFGDNKEKTLDEELATASQELQRVLQDADNRWLVFNSTADAENKQGQIDCFLQRLDEISAQADITEQEPMATTNSTDEFRILIIGKTGNGKSSLGNTITGEKHFPVGRGMIAKTREPKAVSANVQGTQLQVVDTPDINNMGLTDEERKKQVQLWKSLLTPAPDAILLAVRCDIRYTAEEHDIYKNIKHLWENDTELCKRLIVAFTFGDMQDEDLDEELKTVCGELKEVLKDAGNEYILFDNKADAETKEQTVKALLDKLVTPSPTDTTDSIAEKGDPTEASQYAALQSILIIGKTGNGKSSLANIIAGTTFSPVGRGIQTTTQSSEVVAVDIKGRLIKVIDTPDISTLTDCEKLNEISLWKSQMSPSGGAILLAVRCDVRYTAEEHAIYREIKKLWGNDEHFCQRLMVAFTFGDLQDEDLDEELKNVCEELKSVLTDAGNSYLEFNTQAPSDEKESAVEGLLFKMDTKMKMPNNVTISVRVSNPSQDASTQEITPSTCMDTAIKTHGHATGTEGTTSCAGFKQQRKEEKPTKVLCAANRDGGISCPFM